MQKEDVDAPQPLNTDSSITEADSPDSPDSSISEADSIPSRRLKLEKLVRKMTPDQSMHLRELKRRAGRKLHNMRVRQKGSNGLHLELLVQDTDGVLSLEPRQTRSSVGRFGSR